MILGKKTLCTSAAYTEQRHERVDIIVFVGNLGSQIIQKKRSRNVALIIDARLMYSAIIVKWKLFTFDEVTAYATKKKRPSNWKSTGINTKRLFS